ncbi:uncharacterized protein BCR38DRAFT_119953 [Pseudomassariella vexata]|uniref:Uncharacterized protein n=1 Tax=Pseudomassariella vexata TaxID=1141098 RepID=A0A1Y2DA12_9PEZI|nr:uncharacterized protein BCR38DRAFT_119953 [Pseudomassariella vexata]ORY56103.1 hypothetical protein BCR38DRAFT_119953 [Pseudomassariella vexata]
MFIFTPTPRPLLHFPLPLHFFTRSLTWLLCCLNRSLMTFWGLFPPENSRSVTESLANHSFNISDGAVQPLLGSKSTRISIS